MLNEKGQNKKKREEKKMERLKRIMNVDLCACAGGHKLKCGGICRKIHTNSNGKVECIALYQVDCSEVKQSSPRKSKRNWKFGDQKEGNENKEAKQRRSEKWERDRLK